ncbi:MAG TPA: lasso peptide biosynthesis B2 protein [Vicinamibacterales bacterium]|nr:lasso peptide biosynthesis B2 protein [Vicinamibacterales bacterium]
MRRRLRKLYALAREWPAAYEAAALTFLTGTSLRVASFESVARCLLRTARIGPAVTPDDIHRLEEIVNIVAGRVGRQQCLTKAIVLATMLERRGVSSTIYIGARRGEDGFAAHAWLRCGDRLLPATGHEQYAPLHTIAIREHA